MRVVASLRDVEAIEARGLPADLPGSTFELLNRTAQAHPLAPALSYFQSAANHAETRTWNYRQFLAQVTRAANAFHGLGASKDSVIAVVLPNLPESHFAIWGGQAAGIAMPINFQLAPGAIADLMAEVGASILVTALPFPGFDLWEKLQGELARVPSLRHVLLVDLAPPSPDRAGVEPPPGLPVEGAFQVLDFSTCLEGQPGTSLLSGREIDPEDYSSFLCTGGTTGAPKVAMRRHRNEVANAWSTAQCLGDNIAPGKNLFCGLPLFHANGLLVTGLLPFSQGAHVVIGTPFGYRGAGLVANFWSIVEHHQIHFFSAVPTIYGALLQEPRAGRRLDSLKFGLCGAAPMPRELLARFEQETGVSILEGYGLTEGTCVSSLNPPGGERRVGSIGLRIPGQAMKAVLLTQDGSFQRDALDLEVGILVIRGPNVFAGYRNQEQDRGLWLDIDEGQAWLVTGDLGYRDPDGYFWLTGRAKDLIIRGGHNIDPAAIEQPLYAHPAVQLAAAVGRPDTHAGELPVAYVQLKPGQQVSETEFLSYLESRIAERAAMPKAILLVDTMPLTAVGKIHKPELRRRETEWALHDALGAAGVQPKSVRVASDGNARVELGGDQSLSVAQEVVARFTFRCELVCGNDEA